MDRKQIREDKSGGVWKWLLRGSIGLYVLSVIPLLAASVYAYPQSDDWSYSWRSRQAIRDSGLPWMAICGAVDDMRHTYFEWQGTFASNILMALQPGVWNERLYMLVPFIMIGLMTGSVLYLCYAVMGGGNAEEASSKETSFSKTWLIIGLIVAMFMIQKLPVTASSIYWFNGSIHYMGMFSFALIMAAGLVQACFKADGHTKAHVITSSILAIVVGGGNLVLGLSTVVAFVTALTVSFITKNKKCFKTVLVPALFNAVAFAVNVLAPGNAVRAGGALTQMSGISGVISTILHCFYYAMVFPLGEWFDWSYVLYIAVLIPPIWKIVRNFKIDFKLPGLVLFYSYCFLATMYAPNYYVSNGLPLGRINNMISSMYILLIALNVFYLSGWVAKKIEVNHVAKWQGAKMYYMTLLFLLLWFGVLSAAENPRYFTSTLAIHDLKNGSAKEFGQKAAKNIEILNSDDKEVVIMEMPTDSALLTSNEIDRWEYGAKWFYDKENVVVPDADLRN